jgi:hypothetical protein
VIVDRNAGTITTLNPATKEAIVKAAPRAKRRDTDGGPVTRTAPSSGEKPTISNLGPTTVEGHPAVMKRIEHSSNKATTEVWTASDIQLTVLLKATTASGKTTTKRYRNIQSIEPDPSVFTVPKDYSLIDETHTDPLAIPPAAPIIEAFRRYHRRAERNSRSRDAPVQCQQPFRVMV